MKLRITALLLCLACALAFGACGESGTPAGETHTHTPCAVCGLCTDPDCPGEESEKCKGHTPVNPPEEDAELKGMAEYFSGVKIVTERETLTDENGQEKSFEELLDRQLDVFAQDIIYRLTYVYGYDDYGHNRIEGNANIILKNPDGQDYALNGSAAKTERETILAEIDDPNFDAETDRLIEIDIKNIIDYQKSLVISRDSNYFAFNGALNFLGAIEGRYTSMGSRNTLNVAQNAETFWDLTVIQSNFENYSAQYKDLFKQAFAAILCGKTPAAAFSQTEYESLLSQIPALGLSGKEQAISDYILNSVIGSELAERDAEYFEIFDTEYNGVIDDAALEDIDAKTSKDGSDASKPYTGEYNPRFFKGYNIVIPAIVERAAENTFENTETCLYPAAGRNVVRVSQNYETALAGGETFVLMPKAGAPLTALSLELEGQSGQSVTLSLEISVGGKVTPISKTIVLTGGKQTEEIDISPAGSAFGAYDGNLQPTESNALFGNAGGADSHGSNYILLTVSGGNSLAFKGLYDK